MSAVFLFSSIPVFLWMLYKEVKLYIFLKFSMIEEGQYHQNPLKLVSAIFYQIFIFSPSDSA